MQENRPVEGVTWYDAVYYCNLRSKKEGLSEAYIIKVTKMGTGNYEGHIKKADVLYNKGTNGYRLPTEAEWKYAARGGNPDADAWDWTFSGAANRQTYSSHDNYGMDSVGWYSYNNDTWKAEGWTNGTSKAMTHSNVTFKESGKGTHEVKQLAPNRLGLYDMSGDVWEWCWDWHSGTVQSGEVTDPTGAASGSSRVGRGGSWYNNAYSASVCNRIYYAPDNRNYYLGFRAITVVRKSFRESKISPELDLEVCRKLSC